MGLVLQRLLSGNDHSPAAHAFIVGVDTYPWIDTLKQGFVTELTSSCKSALAFFNWLLNSYTNRLAPLGSVRLLLSAGSGERLPNLERPIGPATMANFSEDCALWAEQLSANENNIAIFFFIGHGMGLGFDRRILALHDLGRFEFAPFQGSVSFDNIYAGLAPTARNPNVARKQFYFVDASSMNLPVEDYVERNASHIFPVRLSTIRDDREAPMFFSSTQGGPAYGRDGGLTFFAEALLSCLENEGAERSRGQAGYPNNSWVVTGLSLAAAMQDRAAQEGAFQLNFTTTGNFGRSVFHELRRKPRVPVRIHFSDESPWTRVEIFPQDGHSLVYQADDVREDLSLSLEVGIYRFIFTPSDGGPKLEHHDIIVLPPFLIFSPA